MRMRVIIALLVLFGLCILYQFARMGYALLDDWPTVSHSSLPEYKSLFSKQAQSKLEIIATTTSKKSLPTSSYVYDNQFNIFVYKEYLSDNSGLTNIMTYQNASDISSNAIYCELPSTDFTMRKKIGKSEAVSSVHFSFSGDSIKSIVKNDSLYCYYFKFKTFTINYNLEPYDIIAKADKSNIPGSVAFIKKGKTLYIIVMSVTEHGQQMQQNLLYSMINK